MQTIRIDTLTPEQLAELDTFYRTTRQARLRTRAQMILLSAEEHLAPQQIAPVVRMSEQTVRRWLKRYRAEGLNGLYDAPRSGAPATVTPAYRDRLLQVVRQRPRSLDLPFSLWTLERLADFMAEETGIRVHPDTVRRHLKANEIVLSRPQHKITSPDPEYEVKKRRLRSKEII